MRATAHAALAARSGNPKLVDQCTLPLTGTRVVDRIITDLAVLDVDQASEQLVLREVAPGVQVQEVLAKTACKVHVDDAVHEMRGVE